MSLALVRGARGARLAPLALLGPLAGAPAQAFAAQDAATTRAEQALAEGAPARALDELVGVPGPRARLLEARARSAAADFVGATAAAAAGLPEADADGRRELAWWGTRAALWLQDPEGSRAWSEVLSEAVGEDPTWRAAAEDFASRTRDLERRREEREAALSRSRLVAGLGAFALLALLALAGRR